MSHKAKVADFKVSIHNDLFYKLSTQAKQNGMTTVDYIKRVIRLGMAAMEVVK